MKLGTRCRRVQQAQGTRDSAVGSAVRSRPWGDDLCVDSLAAPAALVREDEPRSEGRPVPRRLQLREYGKERNLSVALRLMGAGLLRRRLCDGQSPLGKLVAVLE